MRRPLDHLPVFSFQKGTQMALPPIAVGALAGALISTAVDELREHLKTHENWEYMVHHLPETYAKLCCDIEKIAKSISGPDVFDTVNLAAQGGYEIHRRGLQHVNALALSSTAILVQVRGLGLYSPTLPASWRTLDYPDGSIIELPLGTSGVKPVLFMYSDTVLGNAI
jgi:hypothetical protein